MLDKEKTAFLLLAFGGADSVENVEPFVKNILKGRTVTRELVEKAKDRYRIIGGKSPLLDITNAQAKAIEAALKKDGVGYAPYVGMRYWHPFIAETLARMKADGVTRAVAVIMSPFITQAATGGYEMESHIALKNLGGGPKVEFTSVWHLKPLFIDAVADNLNAQLESFKDKKDALVIFSVHSLPTQATEGDPYEMLINQSAEKVVLKAPCDYKVAFQSKGAAPKDWIGPSTEDVIEQAKKTGKKGVIVVPFGFVADHVETLYDIDVLFKSFAESKGLVFKRCASLNTNPKFIAAIADVVKRHSEGR
ncbi:MAG: ferrochelatase [Deltaproteobacteria bacterium]|nr:ferrochelatase [Deltaproteobacteria bacterium]